METISINTNISNGHKNHRRKHSKQLELTFEQRFSLKDIYDTLRCHVSDGVTILKYSFNKPRINGQFEAMAEF